MPFVVHSDDVTLGSPASVFVGKIVPFVQRKIYNLDMGPIDDVHDAMLPPPHHFVDILRVSFVVHSDAIALGHPASVVMQQKMYDLDIAPIVLQQNAVALGHPASLVVQQKMYDLDIARIVVQQKTCHH